MTDRRVRTSIWKGLNRMPYIGEGEMRDMQNLSSDAYPFLTTRKGRKPYTFSIAVPGTPGDGYTADVTKLPVPCENELGNVYRIKSADMMSGCFYKYTDGEWHEASVAVVDKATEGKYGNGKTLLFYYTVGLEALHLDAYSEAFPQSNIGKIVKYTGETTDDFEHNALYRYCIDVWYDWYETDNYLGSEGAVSAMPNITNVSINTKYYYKGETNDEFTNGMYYVKYRYHRGRWEKVEGEYLPVKMLPENPEEDASIRWCGDAGYAKDSYYLGSEDTDSDSNAVYFYQLTELKNNATATNCMPEASEEYVGQIFLYTGADPDEFAECYYNENQYDWKIIEHPKVSREVTLKDYLDNYDGCGLTEILEIGALNGKLAALFKDSTGVTKLYFSQKIYGEINNISNECGKKLITVGNKLVVGESGSYLHEKQGETSFFSQGGSFSYTLLAENCPYGLSGKEKKVSASGSAETGTAVFEFWSEQYYLDNPKPAGEFKALAEALSAAGKEFVVYGNRSENSVKQYLKVSSVTYEPEKLLIGYSNGYSDEYADYLRITAEGVMEDFYWAVEKSYDYITFESTDPHYYDVIAWKKRLWGYQSNVMTGTAADIFNEDGFVDWNRGDNTNMEAITQPLWQGGNITGIAALMRGLVYFKEDCITVVQGNYPAIMSSNTIPCRGLPSENRGSIAVANECVYYLSTDGVYRFDGGIPRCISRELKITGTDAVGASDGNKYWLSLKESDGVYALYVYDINYDIWHKEDSTHARSFTMIGGEMYIASGTDIYNINAPQEDISWSCELWFDEGTHLRKKYKELDIRGKVGDCEIFAKTERGEFQLIGAAEAAENLQMKFPPIECEELTVLIRGRGICEIKSMDRVFEVIE